MKQAAQLAEGSWIIGNKMHDLWYFLNVPKLFILSGGCQMVARWLPDESWRDSVGAALLTRSMYLMLKMNKKSFLYWYWYFPYLIR